MGLIPNIMKIFIGLIVIVFIVAIFWATSWRTQMEEIKYCKKMIVEEKNYRVDQNNRDKEEIPKLMAMISHLQAEFQTVKVQLISDFNDAEKPLVKKQKQIIEQQKKQK